MSVYELHSGLLNVPLYLVQSFIPDLAEIEFAVPIRIEQVQIRLIFQEHNEQKCLFQHPNGVRHTYYWRDVQVNQNLFATFSEAQVNFMRRLQPISHRVDLAQYQRIIEQFEQSQYELEVLQGILDQPDTPLL